MIECEGERELEKLYEEIDMREMPSFSQEDTILTNQKITIKYDDVKIIDVEDLKAIVNSENLDVDLTNVDSIRIEKIKPNDESAYTELVKVNFKAGERGKNVDKDVYDLLYSNIHELFPLSSWYTDSEDFYGN